MGFEPCSITSMKGSQVALNNKIVGFNCNVKVYVHDLNTGREVLSVDMPGVRCVCYDEETDSLIVARHDGRIEQYSVRPWKLIKQIGVVDGFPEAMTFADKDDLVVSVQSRRLTDSGKICVYRFTGSTK